MKQTIKLPFTYLLFFTAFFVSLGVHSCPESESASPAPALAQYVANDKAHQTRRAKVLERIPPKYPARAAKQNRDGWVRLSYVIDEQGGVGNVIVTDSSGHEDLERSAARAIAKWQFEPAYHDGKPIVQCDNDVQMDFRLHNDHQGARKKFSRKYRYAMSLIEKNELSEAKEIIDDIKANKIWNFYEDAWFKQLQLTYAVASNDTATIYEQVKSLGLSAHSEELLGRKNYLWVLSQLYVLQLDRMLLADALKTYQKFTDINGGDKYLQSFAGQNKKVIDYINNDKYIGVQGEIGERDFWYHSLARKDFSIVNLEGKLTKIDIRCDQTRYEFDYTPDSTWDIPDSWGACQVYVHGDQGSRFELVELPMKG